MLHLPLDMHSACTKQVTHVQITSPGAASMQLMHAYIRLLLMSVTCQMAKPCQLMLLLSEAVMLVAPTLGDAGLFGSWPGQQLQVV